MGGAVEMCSGLGACRKKLDGTMCPSYMATQGGSALDARPRQRAAAGDGRPARRSGPRRRGRARGARPVPRMPRLQGRVPGRRGHGAVQERVPRRLLEAARHAAARARARPHPRRCRAGAAGSRRSRTAIARSAPGPLAQRAAARHRSPAHAAGLDVADVRASASHDARRRDRCDAAPDRRCCLQRHVHQLLRSRRSAWPAPTCSRRRARVGARAERLLRPAADLAGPARRGASARRPTTPTRCYPLAAAGARVRVLRAELPVGGARGVPSLLRGDAATRARDVAGASCCSRSSSSSSSSRRIGADASRRARRRCCSTATAIRRPWGCCAPAKALLVADSGSDGRRSRRRLLRHGGSFGYAREHYDVSRAIGERRLLPAARAPRRRSRARRQRRLVPSSGRRLHRRPGRCIRPSCFARLSREPHESRRPLGRRARPRHHRQLRHGSTSACWRWRWPGSSASTSAGCRSTR